VQILIVEDDELIAEFIKKTLINEKHKVIIIGEGKKGSEEAHKPFYDAIILDIRLPRMNGLDICDELRKDGITTPILILSSNNTEKTKIAGLDAGADDYLAKPFNYKELHARLRAITRRPSVVLQSVITIDSLSIDTVKHEVKRKGETIYLRPMEYELLVYMAKRQGVALTREQLLGDVWGVVKDNTSNRLEVHIRQLRYKIDKPYKKKLIITVRGIGYKISS